MGVENSPGRWTKDKATFVVNQVKRLPKSTLLAAVNSEDNFATWAEGHIRDTILDLVENDITLLNKFFGEDKLFCKTVVRDLSNRVYAELNSERQETT